MIRARISEGLLAALGTLAATWPLTTLLTGEGWLWRLILLVLLVCGLGMAARATGTAAGVVALTQITGLLLAVLVLDLQLHVGTHALAHQIADLVGDANHTLMTYPAPAPVTPGVEFVLSLIVPAFATAVDLLAVTFRRPAAAGIPLLGVFMLSASNVTSGLNPAYFVALAIIWLSMVAHGSSRQMLGWASALARPSTPTTFENRFTAGHASLARTLGVVGLVLALILPAALPHSSPHFFAGGLGRSHGSGGSGSGSMFGSEADIAKDLHDQGTAPVLVFRTNDISPPPLRVLTTSTYTGGQWDLRRDSDHVVPGHNRQRLQIVGTSTSAATHTYSMHVRRSTIGAPQLAAPFPVRTADLGSVPWKLDSDTGRIIPGRSVPSYSLTYERLDDNDKPSGTSPQPDSHHDLALPSASRARVVALARKIGGRTPFDAAIAIQDYLRSGDFTYSLTLAPRQKAPGGGLLDPLSNFLVTRKGYCIQFATAMIMLARADGIPARMAVGFLPGEENSAGSYHVVKSDAHAWPELWFPGMGWTRFEPTPGSRSGAPPLYTVPISGETPSSPTPRSSTSAPVPRQSAPAPQPATPAHVKAAGTAHVWTALGKLLLVLAVIVALLLILPTLAWWQRRRTTSRSSGHAGRLEAEWTVLQSQLDDLGITPPDGRSPRAAEDYYRRQTDLDSRGDDALHRAVQTLERARYAAPSDGVPSITSDSRELLHEVRSRAGAGGRLKAFLLPATGRRAASGAVRGLLRLPGRLLRRQSR